MAKQADMVVTAHVHIEIAADADAVEVMMDVTRQIEKVLLDSAARKRLNTDDAKVTVGKVLGAGIPRS